MKVQPSSLLCIENLSMQFGGIIALRDIGLNIKKNTITAIIGPNGAGKTTLFNCITGFYRANTGQITFTPGEVPPINLKQLLGEKWQLKDFTSLQRLCLRLYYKMFGGSHLITRAGIARTFQNIRLFNDMTVIENLLIAQHLALECNIFKGLLKSRHYQHAEHQALTQAFAWLAKIHLTPYANRLARELPYGHQRYLEIARAMCTQPILLCLDEPAAGLNPSETKELGALITTLHHEHQVTILLIEHDMQLVMNIAQHIIVLDQGQVIAQGTPNEIVTNPKVISAYLGVEI